MFSHLSITQPSTQNDQSTTSTQTKRSLAHRTLIKIAASVTAVIVGSTAVSYFQIIASLKSQTLDFCLDYRHPKSAPSLHAGWVVQKSGGT